MSYSDSTQRAKYKAGLRGGPYFKNPIRHPAMTIVDPTPSSVSMKMDHYGVKPMPITDPWGSRRK